MMKKKKVVQAKQNLPLENSSMHNYIYYDAVCLKRVRGFDEKNTGVCVLALAIIKPMQVREGLLVLINTHM